MDHASLPQPPASGSPGATGGDLVASGQQELRQVQPAVTSTAPSAPAGLGPRPSGAPPLSGSTTAFSRFLSAQQSTGAPALSTMTSQPAPVPADGSTATPLGGAQVAPTSGAPPDGSSAMQVDTISPLPTAGTNRPEQHVADTQPAVAPSERAGPASSPASRPAAEPQQAPSAALAGMAGALLDMGSPQSVPKAGNGLVGGGGSEATAGKKRAREGADSSDTARLRANSTSDSEVGGAALLDQRTGRLTKYPAGISALPSLSGVYELGTEEITADLHEIRSEHGDGMAAEEDGLVEDRSVLPVLPDPFTRKLALREQHRRLLADEELDVDDEEDMDDDLDDADMEAGYWRRAGPEEEEEEDDDEEEDEEEGGRRGRRQAASRANKRRPVPQPTQPKERPPPRRRPPNLDLPPVEAEEEEEEEEESDAGDDVLDAITTPLPTEFIVAEAERAQYESAFEALKRHIIRTYQNADQGFKRNGYAVKMLQGMCVKEARLLAVRRRKAAMLRDVMSVLKNRKAASADAKARIKALRARLAEHQAGGAAAVAMEVDEEEEEDAHEEDKSDLELSDLSEMEDEREDDEEGEDGEAARRQEVDEEEEEEEEEDEGGYKAEGDVLEEGDTVLTPDGEGVVVTGQRRGNVVVRVKRGTLTTYRLQDVKPKPPHPGAVNDRSSTRPAQSPPAKAARRDPIKAWKSFQTAFQKMDKVADRSLTETMASFIQEFEIDAYYDMRHSMMQRGANSPDDDEVYGRKAKQARGGKAGSAPGGSTSGLPPASIFTAPRGLVPFNTPLMVTALVGLPDNVSGVYHLHDPPARPDRSDVLPRTHAITDATFAPVFDGWSEDKRRLSDLRADVSRLESQLKQQRQQTEEVSKWTTEALQGLNKIKAQLAGLGNDVENLRHKHQAELEIAKIPLSEASSSGDIGKLEGEFSAANLPAVPVGAILVSSTEKGALDDDELDEEAKAAKLRRLEEEEEEEAEEVEQEEKRERAEAERRRRRNRSRSASLLVDGGGEEEDDDEEEEEDEEGAEGAEAAVPGAGEEGYFVDEEGGPEGEEEDEEEEDEEDDERGADAVGGSRGAKRLGRQQEPGARGEAGSKKRARQQAATPPDALQMLSLGASKRRPSSRSKSSSAAESSSDGGHSSPSRHSSTTPAEEGGGGGLAVTSDGAEEGGGSVASGGSGRKAGAGSKGRGGKSRSAT